MKFEIMIFRTPGINFRSTSTNVSDYRCNNGYAYILCCELRFHFNTAVGIFYQTFRYNLPNGQYSTNQTA